MKSLVTTKMESYNNTININFWTHSSKLPHSMNVILARLIGTLTQIMWSLKDRWIQFVAWSQEVRMLHYGILTSSNWILVTIAISKSVKISFPWNKITFICDLKHKHDQCECDSVAWKISLNTAENSHTFYSNKNLNPQVNSENLYPKCKGNKMIFTSNQHLCLNLNELKFELTAYYMSVNQSPNTFIRCLILYS